MTVKKTGTTKPRKAPADKTKRASASKVVKKSSKDYTYSELGKASLTQDGYTHFYGVIIDATFPYKKDANKFMCSLKIVDTTTAKGYATLVMRGDSFEDLPIVQRVGDIIRVHRSTLRLHKNHRQFNGHTINGKQTSWSLFTADGKDTASGAKCDEFAAYSFSGKSHHQNASDKTSVAALRKFSQGYFGSSSNEGTEQLSTATKQKGDFDVAAKITQLVELDEYTNELRIKDSSNTAFNLLALKNKFPHIKQGDVVRIRSCQYDETSAKKILILSHFSNIMTFCGYSKLAKDLKSKVADCDRAADKTFLKQGLQMAPVILTEVDKKHSSVPFTSLSEIFSSDATGTTFKCQFHVVKAEPGNTQEFCKSFDKKTQKAASFKGSKSSGNAIYQVQLLCKDSTSQTNNTYYRILLYTHEGMGANFFSQAATNLYANSGAAKKVAEQAALLTKFNCFVEAAVEKKNGFFFIKDTKMVL